MLGLRITSVVIWYSVILSYFLYSMFDDRHFLCNFHVQCSEIEKPMESLCLCWLFSLWEECHNWHTELAKTDNTVPEVRFRLSYKIGRFSSRSLSFNLGLVTFTASGLKSVKHRLVKCPPALPKRHFSIDRNSHYSKSSYTTTSGEGLSRALL